MINLIKFLKPSLTGNDGKASARSLTNAWIVVLVTALVVNHITLTNYIIRQTTPNNTVVNIIDANTYLILVLCAFIGVLFGIIAFQSITELVRTVRGGSAAPIEVKTNTTTTVTPTDNQIKTEDNGN